MNDKSANDLQMEEMDDVQDLASGHRRSRKKMAIDLNSINSDKRRREEQARRDSKSDISDNSPLKPKNKDKDLKSATVKSRRDDTKSKRKDTESDIASPASRASKDKRDVNFNSRAKDNRRSQEKSTDRGGFDLRTNKDFLNAQKSNIDSIMNCNNRLDKLHDKLTEVLMKIERYHLECLKANEVDPNVKIDNFRRRMIE